MSTFIIQVIDKHTGNVVEWAPGLAVERQLVEDLCNRVASKGVGILRTTAHVVDDVKTSLEELLFELKSDVPAR